MLEDFQANLPSMWATELLTHPASVLVGLAVLTIGVYIYGTYTFWVLRKLNIPGAKPVAFSGNLQDIKKYGGLHMALLEYRKRYGKVFTLCVGQNVCIVVADPDMLKQILVKEFGNFRNRYFRFPPKSVIRLGLFLAKDEDWKRVRAILTPTFTSGKMKQMVPLVAKSCDTLVGKLGEVADTGGSVDMLSWYGQMTLEVILSTGFGVDSSVQTNPDNEFLQKARAIFHQPAFLTWILALPFSHLIRRFASLFRNQMDYFVELAQEIIRARMAHKGEGRKDFVELMLNAHEAGGWRLTEDEMTAQSVTFLLAGHETTGNALTFTTYHLVMNPDVQEKLRDEILGALGSEPDKPLYELVSSLEYLDCVINESLRMNPPVHVMTRHCIKECSINGVTIPAGMEIKYPIYTLHHDPDAWTDPEKFDPERFRGPDKECKHPFQFLPFGAGPRICIGARFAMMEIKTSLVKILSKYRLVRSPDTQVPLHVVSGFTLTCSEGLHIRVEPL